MPHDKFRVKKSIKFAWPDIFVLQIEAVNEDGAPDGEFFAVATYLPLKNHSQVMPALKLSSLVEDDLRSSYGLIKYGLRASLPAKRLWTYSLWESRSAISTFAGKGPHAEAKKMFSLWGTQQVKIVEFSATSDGLGWPTVHEHLNGR